VRLDESRAASESASQREMTGFFSEQGWEMTAEERGKREDRAGERE
jgi:hypothetical protein